MDRVGADFFGVVAQVRDRLGAQPLVLQVPVGAEDGFRGVIDLLSMQAVLWDDDSLGASFRTEESPEALAATVAEHRDKLRETLAEHDEARAAPPFEVYGAPDPTDNEARLRLRPAVVVPAPVPDPPRDPSHARTRR